MIYLVKIFRLSVRGATIKGHATMVRRWLHKSEQDQVFSTKKGVLQWIAFNTKLDKENGISLKYKYTLQCISGGKNGKR